MEPPAKRPAKEKSLTPKEAEAAAEEAGISVLRIKRLSGGAKVGQFIEQLGATRVGRATLILAQEAVEEGLKQCDDTLASMKEEGTFDFELMSEIMKIRLGLVDQLTKVGTAQLKAPDYHPGVTSGNPANRPFPAGVAIGINVSDDKKVEIKAEPVTVEVNEEN